MEMQSVQSSQIAQVGHDGANKLRVLFRRGGLYEYTGVTPEEFDQLMNADSLGSHFYRAIKGVKPFVKIEGTEWPTPAAVPVLEPVREPLEPPASEVVQTSPAQPEEQNQEVERVAERSSLLVQNARSIKVIDPTTQSQASEMLLAVAAMRRQIEETFKPMKEAAFRAHRVICDQEKKVDKPLVDAEASLKKEIGDYILEQRRIAKAAEDEARRIEQERAAREAQEEAERLAIEDAIALEAQGDVKAAEAVLAAPAPVPVRYVAPAPVAPAVAQTSGVAMSTTWDFRILDEAQIPREYLLVNEAAIRALGKSTKGKAKVNGIEFFEKAQVSASRGGR